MTRLTQSTKPVKGHQIKRNWHLLDIKDKVLGRAVTNIARLLQGKHKVDYVPYLDTGDYVVVTNAKSVKVTGRKASSKMYLHYSGYPGGLKSVTFNTLMQKNPAVVIHRAVSGMLAKNKFRKRRLTRLFIFPEEKHPYSDKLE
ncbi:50S ribosomal protein L13 [Candidatus Roizmanbacteria bacterium]|nr:50S ribosomal protein L13 [Candidatus Roizmanbacteria bacterium]